MSNNDNQNTQSTGSGSGKPSSPFQPLKTTIITEGYHGKPLTDKSESNQNRKK